MGLPVVVSVDAHAAVERPVGGGEQDEVARCIIEARVKLPGFVAGGAVAAVEALAGHARRRRVPGVGEGVREGEEDNVANIAAVARAVVGAADGRGVHGHCGKTVRPMVMKKMKCYLICG